MVTDAQLDRLTLHAACGHLDGADYDLVEQLVAEHRQILAHEQTLLDAEGWRREADRIRSAAQTMLAAARVVVTPGYDSDDLPRLAAAIDAYQETG